MPNESCLDGDRLKDIAVLGQAEIEGFVFLSAYDVDSAKLKQRWIERCDSLDVPCIALRYTSPMDGYYLYAVSVDLSFCSWYVYGDKERNRFYQDVFGTKQAEFVRRWSHYPRSAHLQRLSESDGRLICKRLVRAFARYKKEWAPRKVGILTITPGVWSPDIREKMANKKENTMVKFFKDGKSLALQTDSNDEAQFTRDFGTALQDYLTSPNYEGSHELEKYLKAHVEICCKLRGYKAEVREQRLLTVGEINPHSETLVNTAEHGVQTLKAVA